METKSGSTTENVEEWTYDDLGRPTKKTTQIYSEHYTSTTAYDCQSRVTEMTFPSGVVMKPTYDSLGHLTDVKDGSGNTLLEIKVKDANGEVTQLRLMGWFVFFFSFFCIFCIFVLFCFRFAFISIFLKSSS